MTSSNFDVVLFSGMHWTGLDVLLRSRQPFHPTKSKLLRVWLLALRFHRIALSNGSGSLAENPISNSSNRGIGSLIFLMIIISRFLYNILFVVKLRAKQGKNENIVSTMLQDLKPTVRITNNKDIIIQDIIPFSLPIITPSLRPVRDISYALTEVFIKKVLLIR